MARPATAIPPAGTSSRGREPTTGTTSLARRKISRVPRAIAAARGIVQAKSTKSGRANGARGRTPIEMWVVLSPVHWPSPIETRDPIPAAIRPGIRTSGNLGPPNPAASIRSTAAITGEPNRNEIAAKVEAVARRRPTSGGASLLSKRMDRNPRPPAQRDQRRLGSDHGPEADRGERREHDPRQLDGLRGRRVE